MAGTSPGLSATDAERLPLWDAHAAAGLPSDGRRFRGVSNGVSWHGHADGNAPIPADGLPSGSDDGRGADGNGARGIRCPDGAGESPSAATSSNESLPGPDGTGSHSRHGPFKSRRDCGGQWCLFVGKPFHPCGDGCRFASSAGSHGHRSGCGGSVSPSYANRCRAFSASRSFLSSFQRDGGWQKAARITKTHRDFRGRRCVGAG